MSDFILDIINLLTKKDNEVIMRKREFAWYAVLFFIVLFLATPHRGDVCRAEDMEILTPNIAIGTTIRHEWYPFVEYNSIDNEFMVVWHTGGKLIEEDAISYEGIDGQRVSPGGALIGDPFVLSPPEPGWKTLPKLAHNKYTNEYMVTFTTGPEFIGQNGYIGRVNSAGEYLYGPNLLYESPYNISHPTIVFNSTTQEYLAAYNDKYVVSETETLDNLGVILDVNGDVISGPFLIGSPEGTQFNPQVAYNSIDDTYMVNWEDFRNVGGMWDPSDIYGALLNREGEQLAEIAMIDDFGDDDEGDQRVQKSAYNPDRNEFLAVWRDVRPSLDGAGLVGRIFQADGTPTGEDFVIVDHTGDQGYPQLVYVQKKKQYFIAWDDTRNGNSDIYASWLNNSGKPAGGAIPLCTDPGNQGYPYIAYSPLMEQFLIAWRDTNAPDDYDVLPDEGGGHIPGSPGNILGTLYGKPSLLCCQVSDKDTGNPLEGALVVAFGPGVPALTHTTGEGWFNVEKNSRPVGTYLILVFKFGYHMAIQSLHYTGEPLQETIEMRSWW